MTGDLPSIGSSAYGASTSVFQLQNGLVPMGQIIQPGDDWGSNAAIANTPIRRITAGPIQQLQQDKPAMAAALPSRRLVQVFIADPDENVPLDKSLLYSGEQKLTDATDQELFFEIDIKTILEKHNAERIQFVNKKVKERTEFLEPVKIRDLRMVVVNVATF